MPGNGRVLLSWCARNNDPYERDRDGKYQLRDGKPAPGPTLTLLFDRESQYANAIEDVVLLYNEPSHPAKEDIASLVVRQTVEAIQSKNRKIRCEQHRFTTMDPTDHRAIFDFLLKEIPEIRRKYQGRELVIHISPGTPSMQTVWVLMGECGLIEPPFTLVKSYRASERTGRQAVVPVAIGIETFYKAYRESKPSKPSSETEVILWDPRRFQSSKLIDLYSEARRFAQLRVPVLITGERGTGKTTLANWMRANSRFRRSELDRNWASVPCGQYSPETMRAELFGYMKGAFTGAEKDHQGLLKTADGDTLFLDEIGDITRDLQRLLIRALEEGSYYPLGSTKLEKSVFRLITASNLELPVLKKRLDPDFFDRIRTLQLRVPALRELPEDLSWLWTSTFEAALERSGVPNGSVELEHRYHESIVERLKLHPLDGNLRDLLRVANRLIAALCDRDRRLPIDDAVEYSTQALESSSPADSTAREVAMAFYDGRPLDHVLKPGFRLHTKTVEERFRAFMAQELRRIAQQRGVEPEELCDVSSRTLRDWANIGRAVRETSAQRKIVADDHR
jgi:DNA-binding NtrC family response regulator